MQMQQALARGTPAPSIGPGEVALYGFWALLVSAGLLQNLLLDADQSRIWLLDLDVERSVYTWFSQLLLAATAVLLANVGLSVVRADRFMGIGFLVLATLVGLMSLDEALSLHEKVGEVLSGSVEAGGYGGFIWVLPAAGLVLVALIAFIPFLRRLDGGVRRMLLLAAALFFAGALGLELVGAQLFAGSGGDVTSAAYRFAVVIEEALEGLGVLVAISALLRLRRKLGVTL